MSKSFSYNPTRSIEKNKATNIYSNNSIQRKTKYDPNTSNKTAKSKERTPKSATRNNLIDTNTIHLNLNLPGYRKSSFNINKKLKNTPKKL